MGIFPNALFSLLKSHAINALNPCVSSCKFLKCSKCSMISLYVSIWPNIIVAVVIIPNLCACLIMSSQLLVLIFLGDIFFLICSLRISAPPPGIVFSPAFFKSFKTSLMLLPEMRLIRSISGGENACT